MPRRLEVVWEGQVIPFEAPDDASPAQIKTLAARALKASSPGKDFQSPVLARETPLASPASVISTKAAAEP